MMMMIMITSHDGHWTSTRAHVWRTHSEATSGYLGSAVPMETVEGMDAVQQPLQERYPVHGDGKAEGIDCWLMVFSSGLSMQFVADMNTVTWFPINTMHVSATCYVCRAVCR